MSIRDDRHRYDSMSGLSNYSSYQHQQSLEERRIGNEIGRKEKLKKEQFNNQKLLLL